MILTDSVHANVSGLRAQPDPILAEMEAQRDRDGIPIVVPETQYVDHLELLIPLLGERGILAVDNVLMDGTVASGRGEGNWTEEQIFAVRALNERVLALDEFDATLLAVGDGVLVGVRR